MTDECFCVVPAMVKTPNASQLLTLLPHEDSVYQGLKQDL